MEIYAVRLAKRCIYIIFNIISYICFSESTYWNVNEAIVCCILDSSNAAVNSRVMFYIKPIINFYDHLMHTVEMAHYYIFQVHTNSNSVFILIKWVTKFSL